MTTMLLFVERSASWCLSRSAGESWWKEKYFLQLKFHFNWIIFLFLRNVPKQSCQTVPDRQCRTVSITWHIWHTWHTWHIWLLTYLTWLIVQVPKQECRNEPRQTCKTVQRRECQTVPETQCRKGGFRHVSDHWKLNIIGNEVGKPLVANESFFNGLSDPPSSTKTFYPLKIFLTQRAPQSSVHFLDLSTFEVWLDSVTEWVTEWPTAVKAWVDICN